MGQSPLGLVHLQHGKQIWKLNIIPPVTDNIRRKRNGSSQPDFFAVLALFFLSLFFFYDLFFKGPLFTEFERFLLIERDLGPYFIPPRILLGRKPQTWQFPLMESISILRPTFLCQSSTWDALSFKQPFLPFPFDMAFQCHHYSSFLPGRIIHLSILKDLKGKFDRGSHFRFDLHAQRLPLVGSQPSHHSSFEYLDTFNHDVFQESDQWAGF